MLAAFSDEELCVVLDDELDSTFWDELEAIELLDFFSLG